MTSLRTLGLTLAATLALAVGAGVGAQPAGAVYGLLGHYELCSSDGDYGYIRSLSVRENVYLAERHDGRVRVLTQSGGELPSIPGTFKDPIIGTSAVGALYVIDNPSFNPRLLKFSGGSFERELMPDPASADYALRAPIGLVATRPGGRGSPTGEVFVADVTLTGLPAIKVWNADGTFSELYSGDMGRGFIVGITAAPGVVLLAETPDASGVFGQVALLPASRPLHYGNSLNVLESVEGIAAAPDGSFWVLGGASPGFSGIEHYDTIGQTLLERVPIPGGLNAISVAPNGDVWVTRRDGLLRIGPGGAVIPPDQYGQGKCGAPRVLLGLASNQRPTRTGTLTVAVACSEACTVRSDVTLSVPARAARTFTLRPVTFRIPAGRRGGVRLRFSRTAVNAMRRAKAQHQRSLVQLRFSAVDDAFTRSSRRLSVYIG